MWIVGFMNWRKKKFQPTYPCKQSSEKRKNIWKSKCEKCAMDNDDREEWKTE